MNYLLKDEIKDLFVDTRDEYCDMGYSYDIAKHMAYKDVIVYFKIDCDTNSRTFKLLNNLLKG